MFIKYFLIISSVTFFVLFCFDALSYADGITLVGSKQGQSVGFIDIDGDGIDDEIIGAPYANLHLKSGAILVYMGNTYGRFFPRPFVLLSDDDNYGFSFKNIGDTDGDGREDFAVGAINGGGPDVSLSGSVIVYKGYKGSKKIISKLSGEGAMDKFGFFISAGDLNGDGKRDLIVGAPFNTNDPSIYQGGAVYVYLAPYFTSKIAIYASSINKGLGWSAEAGDINGDNIDD
ncbi:FG-GAP repeat protein [Candidatus Desantisbacteria bacterium]|nr:FG-GAP repeat protein [Candidatus Desantisbacteria bacterium]